MKIFLVQFIKTGVEKSWDDITNALIIMASTTVNIIAIPLNHKWLVDSIALIWWGIWMNKEYLGKFATNIWCH